MTTQDRSLKEFLADALIRLHVDANALTLLGFLSAAVSAYLIFLGHFFAAGACLLFSGLLDLLDGAVARRSGKVSLFGGIFDSSLDRYGDGLILGALTLFFMDQGRPVFAVTTLLALLGSFSISYIRARAECDIDSCRVGFWERGERLVWIALGLLLNNANTMVLILCVGVQWTSFQRLYLAYICSKPNPSPKHAPTPPSRAGLAYGVKVALLITALIFLRNLPI